MQSIGQPVENLSGGQRQGVAVARAATWARRLVIMDEPTAALGVKETRQVLDLIRRVRDRGLPVILISHDMPHVFELADRIQIMRLGKRVAVVTPQTHTMPEAVAIMTGATRGELEQALTEGGAMTYVARRRPLRPHAATAAAGGAACSCPPISLGLWQNFGDDRPLETQPRDRPARVRPRHHALRPRQQLRAAVRLGGGELRPAARATTCAPYRDELVISTKAGYDMWPGPYGEWGSRKYLLASLDQSLRRMGLDYVDIFYSHRFDPDTPLEETMGALDTRRAPGQGALRRHLLVLGRARRARRPRSCASLGTPLLIHQPSYSMLNRWIEDELLDALERAGRRLHRLLAARAGDADRQVPRRHPRGLAREPRPSSLSPDLLTDEALATDPRAERDRRRGAARRSRRWRSPGRCATRA